MIPTKKRLEYAAGYLALGMLEEAKSELDLIEGEDRLSDAVVMLRFNLSVLRCGGCRRSFRHCALDFLKLIARSSGRVLAIYPSRVFTMRTTPNKNETDLANAKPARHPATMDATFRSPDACFGLTR